MTHSIHPPNLPLTGLPLITAAITSRGDKGLLCAAIVPVNAVEVHHGVEIGSGVLYLALLVADFDHLGRFGDQFKDGIVQFGQFFGAVVMKERDMPEDISNNKIKKRFTRIAKKALKESGWYPGRSISGALNFSPTKNTVQAAIPIIDEFSFLEICFDSDECPEATNLFRINMTLSPRAILDHNRYLLYDYGEEWEKIDESTMKALIDKYDLTEVSYIENVLKEKCTFIGRILEYSSQGDLSVYVTKRGEIYLLNGKPFKYADNFDEFLNKWIDPTRT